MRGRHAQEAVQRPAALQLKLRGQLGMPCTGPGRRTHLLERVWVMQNPPPVPLPGAACSNLACGGFTGAALCKVKAKGTLAPELANISSLLELSLSGQQFTGTVTGAQRACSSAEEGPALRRLTVLPEQPLPRAAGRCTGGSGAWDHQPVSAARTPHCRATAALLGREHILPEPADAVTV